jgi:peptidoglycan/xylan/chitin deacetylase (PgdA/CDA1 family)
MVKTAANYKQIFDAVKPLIKSTFLKFATIPMVNRALQTWQGPCAIFCLHRILPEKQVVDDISPNSNLALSEVLFSELLDFLSNKYRVISLDDLVEHLHHGSREFVVCLTFDDGYRDNLYYALPILEQYKCPATVFISTRLPERDDWMWWYELWEKLLHTDQLDFIFDGIKGKWDCSDQLKKKRCYTYLSSMMMRLSLNNQKILMAAVTGLEHRRSYHEFCLNWNEIRKLDQNPLVTIGAHTHSHPILSLENEDIAIDEINKSKLILEEKLGHPIAHLAYPFGTANEAGPREYMMAQKCGFKTASTTLCYPATLSRIYSLPRYGIEQNSTVKDIELRISGLCNALGMQIA